MSPFNWLGIFWIDFRCDDELASKSIIQKQLRELENQLQEAQDDLEMERQTRAKFEKQKRDLAEV